jgi:hypothetical protein
MHDIMVSSIIIVVRDAYDTSPITKYSRHTGILVPCGHTTTENARCRSVIFLHLYNTRLIRLYFLDTYL